MGNWFSDTFLPSIFERIGMESKWLTRKQTAVCVEHMEKHVVRQAQFQGDYTKHNYYTTEWRGRTVCLNYSKLNGCGVIQFGPTEEERLEWAKRQEAANAERERQNLERMLRRRPERFMEKLKELRDNVQAYTEYIKQDEAENDMEALEDDQRNYQYYKNQVEMMEAILTAVG